MYITMAQGKPEETAKYIRSVTYHLVPGFNPMVIKVSEPPFLLARVGWGYFELEAVIEFQPHLKMKNMKIAHVLNFNKSNTSKNILIDFDPELTELTPLPIEDTKLA